MPYKVVFKRNRHVVPAYELKKLKGGWHVFVKFDKRRL